MKKNTLFLKVLTILTIVMIISFQNESFSAKKKSFSYVPDEKTAVKIAEAVWLPIFGEKIYKQKPFKAKLIDKYTWLVESTLLKNMMGGCYYIKIRKKDCKILRVYITR